MMLSRLYKLEASSGGGSGKGIAGKGLFSNFFTDRSGLFNGFFTDRSGLLNDLCNDRSERDVKKVPGGTTISNPSSDLDGLTGGAFLERAAVDDGIELAVFPMRLLTSVSKLLRMVDEGIIRRTARDHGLLG